MNKRIYPIAATALASILAFTPAFAQTTGSTGAGAHPESAQGGDPTIEPREGNTGTTTGSPGTQGNPQARNAQINNQDLKFVMEAAQSNLMEIEMSRAAAQKASSADVKAFAQRMVTDHTQATTRLQQVASQLGLTLPTTLPADKRQEMDKMTRVAGAEFDRMYMGHQLQHHKKDVSEFEKQANRNGGNATLQSFARQTLPTLREHYQQAQTIGTKVGAPMDHKDHGNNNQ